MAEQEFRPTLSARRPVALNLTGVACQVLVGLEWSQGQLGSRVGGMSWEWGASIWFFFFQLNKKLDSKSAASALGPHVHKDTYKCIGWADWLNSSEIRLKLANI